MPPNKRLHQTWRGQRLAPGGQYHQLDLQITIVRRATQVLTGYLVARGAAFNWELHAQLRDPAANHAEARRLAHPCATNTT